MRSKLSLAIVLFALVACAIPAFADTAPAASVSVALPPPPPPVMSVPVVTPAQTAVQAPVAGSSQDFLTQVLAAVKNFGGLSTLMKVSTVILLLIASMKVSVLNQLIWSKLGSYQSFVAPALGLVAGLVGLFGGSAPVTIASVAAYLGAGVGAMGLHEVLDGIKAVPGIGPTYVAVINAVESVLGGSAPQA